MRIGVTDPEGPRTWRVAPYVLPILLMLLAMSGPFGATASWILALTSAAIFNALGLVPSRQRRVRTAELVTGPGYIEVRGSGTRNQRIHAKDLVGGTTARTPQGLLLTLQHRRRTQPITLEVETDADAEKIRLALGIGHGGFGTVGWRTQSDTTHRAAFIGRILALVASLITLSVCLAAGANAAVAIGILLGQFGVIGGILGLIGLAATPPPQTILMGAEGLQLKTPRGWFALPYEAILALVDHQRGFVFTVPQPWNTVAVERVGPALGGLSALERKMLVDQVNAAAQRARGLGPHKNDVTARVEVLRRHAESPRDWLTRLDMAGQMLTSSGGGYRGNTLDTDDLWTVLEDPEAEPNLRAAAARVLRHSTGADVRVRIDAAVAATRDDTANRRLRIAIQDDLDAASNELAVLDASEMPVQQAPRGMQYGR